MGRYRSMLKQKLTMSVHDLMSQAIESSLSYGELIDRYQALRESYPNANTHMLEYIEGYFDAMLDWLYASHLVMAYAMHGEIYPVDAALPEDVRAHISRAPVNAKMYWAHSKKPFFV